MIRTEPVTAISRLYGDYGVWYGVNRQQFTDDKMHRESKELLVLRN